MWAVLRGHQLASCLSKCPSQKSFTSVSNCGTIHLFLYKWCCGVHAVSPAEEIIIQTSFPKPSLLCHGQLWRCYQKPITLAARPKIGCPHQLTFTLLFGSLLPFYSWDLFTNSSLAFSWGHIKCKLILGSHTALNTWEQEAEVLSYFATQK